MVLLTLTDGPDKGNESMKNKAKDKNMALQTTPTLSGAENPAPATPTNANVRPEEQPTGQPAEKKTRKRNTAGSAAIALKDSAGNSLRFVAKGAKDGSAITFLKHTVKGADGAKIVKRGGSTSHASFADAQSAIKALADAQRANGWIGSTSVRKAGAIADDFNLDNIPAPVKAAPKA